MKKTKAKKTTRPTLPTLLYIEFLDHAHQSGWEDWAIAEAECPLICLAGFLIRETDEVLVLGTTVQYAETPEWRRSSVRHSIMKSCIRLQKELHP